MHRRQKISRGRSIFPGILAALLLIPDGRAVAQDLGDARKLLLTGNYEACISECVKAGRENTRDEEWPLIQAKAQLALGRYPEAEGTISNSLTRLNNSVRLRILGFDTANESGNTNQARTRLQEINDLAGSRGWAYRDPANILALGRAALLLGADPKTVLEKFFGAVKQADPAFRDLYLVSGELALDKSDFALAAKTFEEGLKKFPNDADMLCGLARAYEPSDRAKMLEMVNSALEQNKNHVRSMLLLVDHLVDAEEYDDADKLLDRALKVNPWCPEAWAYRAVLAYLRNDPAQEAECRSKALHYWGTNPEVDHLIGLKLSQKYRFAEGAACQEKALAFDPDFLPARIQLAEDLLRLGQESEGWKLADQVHQQDGYDVTAYNLVTLHNTMQKFATLTNQDFILRMGAHEAELYGDRALALLDRARSRLTKKYNVTLQQPTVVEIFPEQKDFGVRTFGMPLNPGFLGVCFGCVITANSPASSGGTPENWEDVLWHEFCHVITLNLTKNKMPRWLSEGISVYEERQADPAWGQRMNPDYREMILGGDLTPVSELSAAFLAPKNGQYLQFAYFESSLLVQFVVEKFGFDQLRGILLDLGGGMNINDAIPKHTAPMNQLEKDFAAYANAQALAMAPGLDFTRKQLRESNTGLAELIPRRITSESFAGTNYWDAMEQSAKFVTDQKWQDAIASLRNLIELFPSQSGPANAYALLAAAYRGLGDTNEERQVLDKWTDHDGDALDAFQRLMELGENAEDWKAVALNAERFLEVNPLVPQPYRYLARACEQTAEVSQAINAYRKVLLLDPADPAEVHYRLARLLFQNHDPAAKRQVLQALEDAPRFRDALKLLLEIESAESNATAKTGNT